MAGRSDPLRYAIGRARLSGSKKTIYNHKKEAHRFVDTLRELGMGVQKWTNITNRHVGLVVEQWRQDMSPATIKSYLSGVRAVCRAFGNDSIHVSNDEFGVARRVLITNEDKAVSNEVYERVVTTLRSSVDPLRVRIALLLEYERVFGMRFEEASKFNPYRDFDGETAHIHLGTKGGRPRWLGVWNDEQQELMERAQASGYYRSPKDGLIPADLTEEKWRNRVYNRIRPLGLTMEEDGTMHGLRHAYAQERFEHLTGFAPPVCFDSKEEFEAQALERGGPDWREADELARCVIREEMGHSPTRDDIDSQYLGKW